MNIMEQLQKENRRLKQIMKKCENQVRVLRQTGEKHENEIDTLLKFNERLLGIIETQLNTNGKNSSPNSSSSNLQQIDETNEADSPTKMDRMKKNDNFAALHQELTRNAPLVVEKPQKEPDYNKEFEGLFDDEGEGDGEPASYHPPPTELPTPILGYPTEKLQQQMESKLDAMMAGFEESEDDEVKFQQIFNGRVRNAESKGNVEESIPSGISRDNVTIEELRNAVETYRSDFSSNYDNYSQVYAMLRDDFHKGLDDLKNLDTMATQNLASKVGMIDELARKVKAVNVEDKLVRTMEKNDLNNPVIRKRLARKQKK